MRPGVEPRVPASQDPDVEGIFVQVPPVHRRDLELPPVGGRDRLCHVDHPVVVEVQPRHGEVALRIVGLLLDRHGLSVPIRLDDPKPLRVADAVPEHGRSLLASVRRIFQEGREALPVKDVVSQNQGHAVRPNKVLSDGERLRDALRLRLHGVLQVNPQVRPVAQQPLKGVLVPGRSDHQNVPDPGQHEDRERVVDHRLVVDRKQLLRHGLRHRIQPCALSTSEYDSFH